MSKNIEMNYRNESGYEVLYPNTQISNVLNLQNQLNSKLNLSGGIMTGNLVLRGDPTITNHAANKGYVDSQISSIEQQLGLILLEKKNTSVSFTISQGYRISNSINFGHLFGEENSNAIILVMETNLSSNQTGLNRPILYSYSDALLYVTFGQSKPYLFFIGKLFDVTQETERSAFYGGDHNGFIHYVKNIDFELNLNITITSDADSATTITGNITTYLLGYPN